jgi:hypothetical protein
LRWGKAHCCNIWMNFSMQIEDHVNFLHGFEDWVICLVGFYPTIWICGNAARIGFYAYEAIKYILPYDKLENVPTIPASLAFRISFGVNSGERYRVIKYWTSGSILCRSALYLSACSVEVMGGFRLGFD